MLSIYQLKKDCLFYILTLPYYYKVSKIVSDDLLVDLLYINIFFIKLISYTYC